MTLPVFRRLQEAHQKSHCLKHRVVCTIALRPGQEYPDQGDMLELTQVDSARAQRRGPAHDYICEEKIQS